MRRRSSYALVQKPVKLRRWGTLTPVWAGARVRRTHTADGTAFATVPRSGHWTLVRLARTRVRGMGAW